MRYSSLKYAVAGGSDIALCADIVIMAEDAKIGYMPARVWFKEYAEQHGFHKAVQWRDGGKPIPERRQLKGKRST